MLKALENSDIALPGPNSWICHQLGKNSGKDGAFCGNSFFGVVVVLQYRLCIVVVIDFSSLQEVSSSYYATTILVLRILVARPLIMKSRSNMNSIYRQGSGDSSYSQRSSDLSLNEEREHFRRDTERQALLQLEKGRAKPVAFSVKTNVAFDGTLDDDSPVHGYAISFSMGDYLHVMER